MTSETFSSDTRLRQLQAQMSSGLTSMVALTTPQIGLVNDDQGALTGPIPHMGKTDDTTPIISGSGVPVGSIVIVYDNGVEIGSVVATQDGQWVFAVSQPLAAGRHAFTVKYEDGGQMSGISNEHVIFIDDQAPGLPVITAVMDDKGTVTGNVAHNGLTDDARPELKGTADAGSIILVYDGIKLLGSTTADASGNWSFTPPSDLANGKHYLRIEARDEVGNSSGQTSPYVITVDNVPPNAPIITTAVDNVGAVTGNVANNGTTDDTRPELKGTAEAGSTVRIYDGATLLGLTTADASGNWSFTPATDLANGTHSFTADARDVAGNLSGKSAAWGITLSTVAPTVSITHGFDNVGSITGNFASGTKVDDTTPTLHGKATAGGVVKIYEGTVLKGSTTADAAGNWSYTLATLSNGPHDFTATVTTPASGESAKTAVFNITVDNVPPNAPIITTAVDNVGAVTGNVANNGTTDDTRPELKGTAEAGSTVRIYDGATLLGLTTADASGNWSFTPATDLANGTHSFTADARDVAGNLSGKSAAWGITLSTVAPTVSITHGFDNVGSITGNFASGTKVDDTTPTLHGKATAGGVVKIYEGTVLKGSTTADAAGNWSYTLATLSNGPHDFTATVTTPASGESAKTAVFNITVDNVPPNAPIITTAVDNVGAVTGNVANNGTTDDTRPELKGTAEASSTVRIYDGATLLGQTTADASGNWSFTPATDLANGTHSFTADARDVAGNLSGKSAAWGITLSTVAPTVSITHGFDNVGSITGNFASGTKVDDTTPTLHGKATAGGVVKIYEGTVLKGSTTADAAGNWSYTLATLSNGPHDFTATVTTPASGESAKTAVFNITVDNVPPNAPIITTAVDNVGAVTGNVANNGTTDDTRPELKGTAEASSTVRIYDGATLLGQTTADASGNWSFTPATDLANGTHSFTADARDVAGNLSGKSAAWGITLSTVAPTVSITHGFDNVGSITGNFASGTKVDDTTPTLHGKATAGGVVKIYEGTVLKGSTTADAAGNWSYTLATLSNGPHDFTATVTTPASGESAKTAVFNITVDNVPPNAPIITTAVDNVGAVTGNVANNGTTDDTRPELKGTAEASSTVRIYDGATLLGQTTADASGNWSFTPATDLANGTHSFTADARDVAGNLSGKSSAWGITLSTVAPTVSITHGFDNVGSITGNFASGTKVDDTTPTLHGKATAGGVVKIYEGTVLKGSTTADAAGNWSYTLATLSNGPHDFTATVTTPASGESAKTAVFNITVDNVPPNAPIITTAVDNVGAVTGNVANNGTTDDTRPELKGTAEASSTVRIYDGATLLGQTTADASGNWSFTPATDLANGTHSFTADARDVAGNLSGKSSAWGITVVAAPVIPVITSTLDNVGPVTGHFVDGATIDDDTPTFIGTATANTKVQLWATGDKLVGETISDASGNWSITLAPHKAGYERLAAATVNAAGVMSGWSNAWVFYIQPLDTTPPGTPSIISVVDNVGAVTGNVANNGTTDDTRPELKGTAEAGSTVRIYDGATLLGSTTADASGNWSFTPATDLANGTHSFTADARDVAGNLSGKSAAWGITLSTVAPTVSITHAVDDVLLTTATGIFYSGETIDDTTPTLHGKATANAVVKIYEGTTLKGSTTANASGDWSFTVPALSAGLHSLTATATTPVHGESAKTPAFTFTVVMDTTPPNAPVITTAVDNVGAVTGNVANNGTTDDTRPELKGTAEAGNTVRIYDGATLLGSTTADASGNWSFTPATDLANGTHSFTADARDVAGNLSGKSAAWGITLSTVAPIVSITHAVDDVLLTTATGIFYSGETIDDTTPTLHGKATANAVVKIYEGTTLKGSTTANASGDWSFTVPALSAGLHSLTATATTPVHGESAKTPAFTFTVVMDTTPPNAPVIISAVDNVGTVTGNFASGSTIDDTTPTFKGTAEANAKIFVYGLDYKLLGTTMADASGNWSFTSPALSPGYEQIGAIAEDAAGNRSGWSNEWRLIIDTTPTQRATVTSVSKDTGFDSTDELTRDGSAGRLIQGTLNATLQTGQKLQVSTNGSTWVDAIVDGTKWVAQDGNSHGGNWAITTRVMDTKGQYAPADTLNVTLDTVAPKAATGVTVSGTSVTVAFDKTNVMAGDRITVMEGSTRFEYVLTSADITAGKATFNPGVTMTEQTKYGMVDRAGNLSSLVSMKAQPLTQNFENVSDQTIQTVGMTADAGNLLITRTFQGLDNVGLINKYDSKWNEIGLWETTGVSIPQTRLLEFYGGVKIDLKGATAKSLAFDFYHSQITQTIRFYDAQGVLIQTGTFGGGTVDIPKNGRATFTTTNEFSSFELYLNTLTWGEGKWGTDWIAVDEITWGQTNALVSAPDVIFHDVASSGIYHGASANDIFNVANAGTVVSNGVEINGNSGTDTIKLIGSGQTLDLVLAGHKISSVEIIDLTGTGNNTLKLSVGDVLEQGGKDLFHANGDVQMMVKGNAGDSVALDDLLGNGMDVGDWAKGSSVTVDGVTYASYQHSGLDAELLVQSGVTVNLV
ncbi:Ig-like domain-containing protein [Pseudomonas siliginis]|uniref:Ig-like domain-containing protein n=1 Tax=Pseudomonas siliginis TaxID=2842346 RepID=UPI002092BE25|nr:Ig-like domain-containing protein [Pseudomonas siliginis]UST72285.1 Ig-like domain-containing protein [Pseudomonas siliginis]